MRGTDNQTGCPMAEQFDWSKVLERMKEDGEPAAPKKAPPPPLVFEAAPQAPSPVEAIAEPVSEPTPEEAPAAYVDPLAWDEDDVVVAPAVVAEKPTSHSPDPVIALDWDDEPVAPFEAGQEARDESQTLENPHVVDGAAMFEADVEPEVTEHHIEEQVVHEAGPTVFVAALPTKEPVAVVAPVPPVFEEASRMVAEEAPSIVATSSPSELEVVAVAPPVAEPEPTAPPMAEALITELSEGPPLVEALQSQSVEVEPPSEAEFVALVPPMAEQELTSPPMAEAPEPVAPPMAEPVEADVLTPPLALADENAPPPLPPLTMEAAAIPTSQASVEPQPMGEPVPAPPPAMVMEVVAQPEPEPTVAEAQAVPPLLPEQEPLHVEATAPVVGDDVALPEPVIAETQSGPPPLPEQETLHVEATAPVVEEEQPTPTEAPVATDERPKIKLLATPFDPTPKLPEEPAPVAEMPAPMPEPELEAMAQPVSFSMDDLDKLKVEQAIGSEPTPPATKAETKKSSRAKREEPAPAPESQPELKLVKRDTMTSFGLSDKRLGSALLDVKAITRKQLEEALAEQVETAEPLGRVLVRKGYASIAKVLQVVAMQRGLDSWDLETDPPKPEAMGLVSGETCQRLGVLPVALKGDLLVLAMVDPDDSSAIEEVRKETNLRVQPVLADPERLAGLVQRNYHLDARASSVMDTLVNQALQTAKESGHANSKERATVTEEETRPVVGFVNQIIHDAIRMHASDIHIEPRFEKAEIRYRLDGQLMTMREIPQALVPMVTTRLKIMADLDIVEYRVPQDGRMALQFGTNTIDLRVSCLPSLHGQRIVMRVLDKSIGLRRLDDLGFDPENLAILRSLVEKPYGLLLATGPTGSGKTTTLYAAIQEMRRDGQNVMTCEDPVEYDLEGVNQSQVNERVGLTFAEQLRAILRQDPDIVLVGEVRDHETAETAVRAAMTGHMVLSTLHCNDAPSAIARLLDLGIDPFLLSTSLIGTMSQRLVRRLCPTCRREEEPTPEETEMMERHFGVEGVDRVWRAIGCDKCHKTGYKGRVAVSEIMPVVEEIAALIAARAPLEQIKTAASLYGYLPMQSDAMVRVARGETSLDEARRTVFFDTIQRRATPRQIAV